MHTTDQMIELQHSDGDRSYIVSPEDCRYLENAPNRYPILVAQGFADVQSEIDTDTNDAPHFADYAKHFDDFSSQTEFGPVAATNVIFCRDPEKQLTPSHEVSDADTCNKGVCGCM